MVRRYRHKLDWNDETVEVDPDGRWVKYADYKKLEKKIKELEIELEFLRREGEQDNKHER